MPANDRDNTKVFFDYFIDDFGRELNNIKLKGLTSNADIIGKYAECIVRKMISKVINLARISTGSVLTVENIRDKSLSQLDTIIWIPNPLPATFEAHEFALVSKTSVLGILEIKNTNYSGAVNAIKKTIELSKDLIPNRATEKEAKGIICVKTSNETELQSLETANKVFVLSTLDNDSLTVNKKGIISLLNYLATINTDSISEKFYMKVDVNKLI
jgi:hypothetical protein